MRIQVVTPLSRSPSEAAILRSATGMLVSLEKSNNGSGAEIGYANATIVDKTLEKIVYLGNIFLNIVAVRVLPSPPSPESNVVVYSKESLIPGRL